MPRPQNLPLDPIIPRKFSDRRRDTLLDAIAEGLAVPVRDHPSPVRQAGRRTSDAEKRRVAELQKRRDARAQELAIDPTLIASRAVLQELAENWDQAAEKVLMKWQLELLK